MSRTQEEVNTSSQPHRPLGARTPARIGEPDFGCRDPASKSEEKGKGAEMWKPALGEGHGEGEHLAGDGLPDGRLPSPLPE